MSASSEYEPAARQDYGPTTSSENVYEHVYDHKLTNMNIPSIRTPVLRAVSLSPSNGDPEPDSTNPENTLQFVHGQHIDKDTEYRINENPCEPEGLPITSLSGMVRIEETTLETVSHIAYPVIQETDDSGDATAYVDNSGATLIQTPLNTTLVQNVTKLPQNFTINVDATVGTAIQNVSQEVSSGQTLWLPTILATGAAQPDGKSMEEDRSQAGLSQIIITSESYVSNEPNLGLRRPNIVTDTNYFARQKPSKVQILNNISIPKNQTYSQQYIASGGKEAPTQLYTTQNHMYKLSTNIMQQKHLDNSILCTKPPKGQSLIGCPTLAPTVVNSAPLKNISYGHTFMKSNNMGKTMNKVNNGANLNAMVAASSGNTQCHILSRVVSGPNKLSVHSGRKSGTLKGSKNASAANPIVGSQPKTQSRAIKIIQQTGAAHKDGKNWSMGNVGGYKNQSAYSVMESKVIQKVGSPTHKSVAVQKMPTKGDRLVLQSPCGPVIISTAPIAASLHKAPHYVQAGATPHLRYMHTYSPSEPELSNVTQVSANQQLTAQILQSLSQPKLLLHHNHNSVNHTIMPAPSHVEVTHEIKPINQRRIVYGDPSTLLTADDIIGMEERPNLSEELIRYSFQALAFVMLDHTYAEPMQKHQAVGSPTTTVITGPVVMSPTIATTPQSPVKGCGSPVMSSSVTTYELQPVQLSVPTSIGQVGQPVAVAAIQMTGLAYKPQPHDDDDAASVISSMEGDRRAAEHPDRGGSDTETAPEGEEEGKTRCVCGFTHDDGYMICCDRCGEWQHVDCMGIDRQNIPDKYMCELCQPRLMDRRHARHIQLRKREELETMGVVTDSDSSEVGRPHARRKRLLTVTTYTNTSGTCVTTYNSNIPILPPLPTPAPPPPSAPKRGPKRPKKAVAPLSSATTPADGLRKGTKRKLTDKRVKRKKELVLNRNKYNSNLSSQSPWQDYEQAVTNHYSPELRAKVMKYSNRLGSSPSMASAINAHMCTTVPHAGGKILIATRELKENTPIIELRGKYMLSNQHRPQPPNAARAGGHKPGPFVFFYKLPKDNTQICIDTRTYGNEARFVRRSCKANAELQHCIVKGTLHVYLVTVGVVQANTEITVRHDSNGGKHPCACMNPKHCTVNGLSAIMSRQSSECSPREKRIRNRCSSATSPDSPPVIPAVPPLVREESPETTPVKIEKKSPIKSEVYQPLSPVKNTDTKFDDVLTKTECNEDDLKLEADLYSKEEVKPEVDEVDSLKVEPDVNEKEVENYNNANVMEIDVSEIPIPKTECPIPEEKPVTVEEDIVKEEEEEGMKNEPTAYDVEKPIKQEEVLKSPTEEEKCGRNTSAKSACYDRSSRSSRNTCINHDSLDDKTDDSQDRVQQSSVSKDKKKMTREERKMEAIMKAFERMEKAEQRKQEVKERQKRRESDPAQPMHDRDLDDDDHCATKKRKRRKGRARTVSQNASNRRRLNSADSDMVTSGDEAPAPPSPQRAPPDSILRPMHVAHDTHAPINRTDAVAEDFGLSSACLLVEAAVGSVESAFKLPKTKKTMATEWVGRSPERTPSPYRSPYRTNLVSAPSLESLVRVASTMIGDLSGGGQSEHEGDGDESASPPRTPGRDRDRDRSRPPKKSKRVTRNTPPAEVAPAQPPQHSAKKRWLRQAISEESDSPATGVCPFTSFSESPPNEMVTPLKKRRLARESLSCEQSTVVTCNDETSPNMTPEESPVKEDGRESVVVPCKIRNIMDSLYGRERSRSESGHGSDDQSNLDSANDVLNVNLKVPHDSENIRRIIGVPGPEDMETEVDKPVIDFKTINNNIGENVSISEDTTKVVPMEIEIPVPPQTKISIESNDSNSDPVKESESPNDKQLSSHSANTSGNSSPQRDEMDDIQKKIHSFHTENILILKSRNKKPPKEKRKKVNLNFDLNMVDDQISIQLRTELNGDIHDEPSSVGYVSMENIPLPPVESIPLPAPESIPLPEDPTPVYSVTAPETIPLPEEPIKPTKPPIAVDPPSPVQTPDKPETIHNPSVLEKSNLAFSTRFSSTGLFSGIFSNMNQSLLSDSQINENVPNMQIIKSAIDRTTCLDSSIFSESAKPVDELKSVQEILTRVNSMDSNNSLLLSDVLKGQEQGRASVSPAPVAATTTSTSTPSKPYCPRSNDPRLNPPPVDKPKPVRRKLSISEYRKRLKSSASVGGTESEGGASGAGGPHSAGAGGDWSSESSSLSPLRLDAAAAAAADELEQRLHRALTNSSHPKGVFDAQPTQLERQRENLSQRLRREFGFALPEDEEARPATALHDNAAAAEGETPLAMAAAVGAGAGAGAEGGAPAEAADGPARGFAR